MFTILVQADQLSVFIRKVHSHDFYGIKIVLYHSHTRNASLKL